MHCLGNQCPTAVIFEMSGSVKQSLAMALRELPCTIAKACGLDATQTIEATLII